MKTQEKKHKIEFGDFQTPESLAICICTRLASMGFRPDIVIEPTCGVGAFVLAAAKAFPDARSLHGFEVNQDHLDALQAKLAESPNSHRIHLENADFFQTDWTEKLRNLPGSVLVVGNFPWVTNAGQGLIGGTNLPEKTNFQGHNGFEAITGKANFDISEWMLLAVLRWFKEQAGDIAMLVKTAVARKILSQAERLGSHVRTAFMIKIDAKKNFAASVDACLLVIRLSANAEQVNYDYTVFECMEDEHGARVGHREGLTVSNLDAFAKHEYLIGKSPQKWRSGVKHDASAIMEFTRTTRGLENGLGEVVELEEDYLFPLCKGSDVGSTKPWRDKYILVTQQFVGEPTSTIREVAPKTWAYLLRHAGRLDARQSSIYKKNPRFSVFGVGDYTFRPWRIAICGLYKRLRFRLQGPINGRPVMFDDTVYFISFDTEAEAAETLDLLNSQPAIELLSSLIFWDEKRPIKTGILNVLDWSRLKEKYIDEKPDQLLLPCT